MSKNLTLYIPKLEDYWYEQKLNEDPATMSYNAGYDVSYFGYHYDTGCIDFPKERWQFAYDRRVRENRYFAYIKDLDINEFIGYCNYQFNSQEKRYECGIVIEARYRNLGYAKNGLALLIDQARNEGVKELYDNFEENRGHTLDLFLSNGFEVIKKESWKKFGEMVDGVVVRIKL